MRSGPDSEGTTDDRSPTDVPPADAAAGVDDRTARARIRDAAIERFGEDGVDGTSVRAIAASAAVSPALVMHHFGSKDALRVACDHHVAALIRERKTEAVAKGPGMDPVAALRESRDGSLLLRYLARTLVDGSPHVGELLDEIVADAERYLELGERTGMFTPTDDRRGRAVVLTLWSLGALVLHEHAQRLLGADLTGHPAGTLPYFVPAVELLGRGALTPEAYDQIMAGLRHAQEDGSWPTS